jgi:hypothetical protein
VNVGPLYVLEVFSVKASGGMPAPASARKREKGYEGYTPSDPEGSEIGLGEKFLWK